MSKKLQNIIKKYGEKISYEDYMLILKSSKKYYLNLVKEKPKDYRKEDLHPFLVNTFIAFKKRGITENEWVILDNEVKQMILKGAI